VARERDLLVNFERMRREMDELFGDVWGEPGWPGGRRQAAFTPRMDVYYCGGRPADDERVRDQPPRPSGTDAAGLEPPKAIVKVDLAGVGLDSIGLEVVGRRLLISGERPIQETEGRVYQQVEIEAGRFRRTIELNADPIPEDARATYEDGILRIELPLRPQGAARRTVPVETRE
jgi:HSP20 family protein